MLPKKLKAKVYEGWFTTFIDYNNQSTEFHTRLLRHLRGDKNFLGEHRQVYYFQFDSEEKINSFLNIMKKSFDNLNIRTQ